MTDVAPDPAATPPTSVKLVNLPNALTLLRLAVVPVFAVLLLESAGPDTASGAADGTTDAGRYWATLVFALAIITDRYDGMIARRTGQVTEFGKLADPIADKALTGTALVGLSVLGLLPWWVTAVILVREVGVTVLRFWVIRHGVIAASRGGKLKTVLQALAIGLYILPLTGVLASVRWWVMAAAVLLTVLTGLDYVYRALTLRRTSARAMQAAAARRAAGTTGASGSTGARTDTAA
jgi:CDP-diacylglycerol--glycerol-3-phosphate 3-phosphatidyltransferase